MFFICDDVTEKDFFKLEQLKRQIPTLKVNCFVMGKDAGNYLKQDWVEVGVHGWEHSYPPECERSNQEEYIVRGLEALRKYLPKKIGFRAPGFQLTALTYPILEKLGFYFIAHQYTIQRLDNLFKIITNHKLVNTHIYNGSLNKRLDGWVYETFRFISEELN